ncbi:MAG: type II toxin-antitoxin system VapC family toxin [Opitutales bacterium]
MSILLDTVVVSELRKNRRAAPNVVHWIERADPDSLYLSVVTLTEILAGAHKAKRSDQRFSDLLFMWYADYVLPTFQGRILAIEPTVAESAAPLLVERPSMLADMLLAATAQVHGLTLATRNVKNFEGLGIEVVNPWADA